VRRPQKRIGLTLPRTVSVCLLLVLHAIFSRLRRYRQMHPYPVVVHIEKLPLKVD
jgi:hypothetical protein